MNDSHGDMQNLLHTELDPRVQYIQGAVKPVGMVAGLDSTFDAVIWKLAPEMLGVPLADMVALQPLVVVPEVQ